MSEVADYAAQATVLVAACHEVVGDESGFIYLEGITLLPEAHPDGEFTLTGLTYEASDEVVSAFPVFLSGGQGHPGMSVVLGEDPVGFGDNVVVSDLPHVYDPAEGVAGIGIVAEFKVEGAPNPSDPAIVIRDVEYLDGRGARYELHVNRELWITRFPVGDSRFCAEYEKVY